MQFVIPYIVGALVGVPVGLLYGRFKEKPIVVRVGLGLLVGIGIAIAINASMELVELSGIWPSRHSEQAVPINQETRSAVSEGESKATSIPTTIPSETTSWEQEQRYDDGTVKAMRTVTRNSDGELIPHGTASTYYPNGKQKWTGNYKMGRQVGFWSERYPDGSLEGEGNISEDGTAWEKHWHANGLLKSQGVWRRGAKHGEWKTWYASGQLAGVYHYQDGQLHGGVREWHPNGKMKLDQQFEGGKPLDQPKQLQAEKANERAKDAKSNGLKIASVTVNAFIKGLRDRDLDGVMATVDTPWVMEGVMILDSKDELREFLNEAIRAEDYSDLKAEVIEVVTFKAVRDKTRIGELLKQDAKNNDLVFHMNIKYGSISEPLVLLVRVQGDKAKIIGNRG